MERVEEIMNSLDGIRRAEPAPWFFTRVQARLSRNDRSVWSHIGAFLSRPVVAAGGLLVIVLLNGVLLLNQGSSSQTSSETASQTDQQLAADNEYITATNSSFEYENLVQP